MVCSEHYTVHSPDPTPDFDTIKQIFNRSPEPSPRNKEQSP